MSDTADYYTDHRPEWKPPPPDDATADRRDTAGDASITTDRRQ
jgi:hypothetical protein